MRVPAMAAMTTIPRMAPMAMMVVVTAPMITVIMPMLIFTINVTPLVILHFVLYEVPE